MKTTTTTTFKFRIEEKPGGGFIARTDDATMESVEGATREEVQQKLEEKLTSFVGDQIQKQFKIGGADVKLNIARRVTTKVSPDTPAQTLATNSSVINADPGFETSGMIWKVIAALVAVAALILYLLKR